MNIQTSQTSFQANISADLLQQLNFASTDRIHCKKRIQKLLNKKLVEVRQLGSDNITIGVTEDFNGRTTLSLSIRDHSKLYSDNICNLKGRTLLTKFLNLKLKNIFNTEENIKKKYKLR